LIDYQNLLSKVK